MQCRLRSTGQALVSVLGHVRLFLTPWTAADWVPLSVGFSRQEYWSGLSFPLPGDLPNPGIQRMSPASSVLAGGFFTKSATWATSIIHQISS